MRSAIHGRNATYVSGCRCDACRAATRRYHKALVLDHHRGRKRLIDATGTRRRLEALMWLGWTGVQIGERIGSTGEHVRQLRSQGRVTRDLARRVDGVYEDLWATKPPESTRVERHNASRQRNKARTAGWLPPLAWVDIDNPAETPDLSVIDDEVDEVVVDRLLGGDWSLRATRAERWKVIERWPDSDNELERRTGWNVARDRREMRASTCDTTEAA